MHLPDRFQDHDTQARLYAEAGLDCDAIVRLAMSIVQPSSKLRVIRGTGPKLISLADPSARKVLRQPEFQVEGAAGS
jgi:hypothetical protein